MHFFFWKGAEGLVVVMETRTEILDGFWGMFKFAGGFGGRGCGSED